MSWAPLTRESTDATQARICDLLGLSRATFRASAFVGQNDGAAFTEAKPAERKAVLAEILALDQWARALDRVRADRRAAEDEVAGLRAKAEVAQAVVDTRPGHELLLMQAKDDEQDAGVELTEAEWSLSEARDALAAQAANEERVRAAEAAYQAVRRGRDQLRAQTEAVARDQDRHAKQSQALVAKRALLRQRADAVLGRPAVDCDRCGRPLDDDGARRAAASYAAEADAIIEEVAELDDLVLEAHGKLDALAAQSESLDLDQPAVKVAHAREALGDMTTLRTAAQAASDAVARHRATLGDARARVIRAEAELERCQQAEQELAATVERTAEVATRVETLVVLERAFGPNGIPAWLIERYAVPQIEAEANRILDAFATPYRVELRTQREKKDGGLREALDIVVSDGMHEGDYSEFSGGEKTRLNLALRIALAGLLANRRGAESRVLCIDEPDGLDAAGMEQLAGILGDLVTRGVFAIILIVSHNPLLASAFDQTLTIEKQGDRSRIAGAVEMVPA